MPIEDIEQHDIRDCLKPIWHNKTDKAPKAINRLKICFDLAAALNLEAGLQAITKAKALLGKQKHTPVHVPAMPWRDVPDFYASLNAGTVTHPHSAV